MTEGNVADKGRPPLRILLLGGTGEARLLARALLAEGHAVVSALAGRTPAPALPEGSVRIGGFGGATGLAAYLQGGAIDLLIDATHPFAARISVNAAQAAQAAGIPILRLSRPPWPESDGAGWRHAADVGAAAALLPSGARVFLTIGRQGLAPFLPRTDCHFLARMIAVPSDLPDDWTAIAAQGPFALADEIALMRRHGVTHLVTKNAGGAQTYAKLAAAHTLGIAVVMIDRPLLPPVPERQTVAEALAHVRQRTDGLSA